MVACILTEMLKKFGASLVSFVLQMLVEIESGLAFYLETFLAMIIHTAEFEHLSRLVVVVSLRSKIKSWREDL